MLPKLGSLCGADGTAVTLRDSDKVVGPARPLRRPGARQPGQRQRQTRVSVLPTHARGAPSSSPRVWITPDS